jgi:hypothetical protein
MLTTLGIVIGVGAVIAMMEIGEGSSSAIQRSITTWVPMCSRRAGHSHQRRGDLRRGQPHHLDS